MPETNGPIKLNLDGNQPDGGRVARIITENKLDNSESTIQTLNRALLLANLNSILQLVKFLSEGMRQQLVVDPKSHPDLLQLVNLLFSSLDYIHRQDDESQVISVAALRPRDIRAVSLGSVGLQIVIPKNSNERGAMISISLDDLDQFRLREFQLLQERAQQEPSIIRAVLEILGGFKVDRIFPDKSE